MILEELKSDYRLIVRTLSAEKRMREAVFRPGHPKRAEKIGEIDTALQALERIKDVLKAYVAISPETGEQLPLITLPVERNQYQ